MNKVLWSLVGGSDSGFGLGVVDGGLNDLVVGFLGEWIRKLGRDLK